MNTETHLRSNSPGSAFEAEGDDQVMQYGSPSALAIVSCLFGLAAPLGFVTPLLMVIPVFGAGLALVALYRVATSEGALIGRRAAMIGLALCVVFGVAAVSRTRVMRHLRSDQAQALVRQWFDLVKAGQLEPAFRLTYRGAAPEAPARPMPGEPEEKIDPLQQFKEDPTIRAIEAAGEEAEISWIEDLRYQALSRGGFIVEQRYQVFDDTGESDRAPIELHLALQLSRIGGDAAPRWLVASYSIEDPRTEASSE